MFDKTSHGLQLCNHIFMISQLLYLSHFFCTAFLCFIIKLICVIEISIFVNTFSPIFEYIFFYVFLAEGYIEPNIFRLDQNLNQLLLEKVIFPYTQSKQITNLWTIDNTKDVGVIEKVFAFLLLEPPCIKNAINIKIPL